VTYILWRIDPLLGKDLETNKETTAVVMQRRGKRASTRIELYWKRCYATRCYSAPTAGLQQWIRGCFLCGTYREVILKKIGATHYLSVDREFCDSRPVKRRLRGWYEMAGSLGVCFQLRVEFCTGGCKDRTLGRKTEEFPLLEAVASERLLETT
jgi:hypothetical protein